MAITKNQFIILVIISFLMMFISIIGIAKYAINDYQRYEKELQENTDKKFIDYYEYNENNNNDNYNIQENNKTYIWVSPK